ncbi:MAG: PorT family protein [Cytophagales bacterium]|nr:PorT family protein [Cytophaga sp.]
MKKLSLLFLTTVLAFSAFSQVTIGLRVAPSFCINRVHDKNTEEGVTYSSNGTGVRFAIGPTIDFKFGENYAFSTGAWYLSSRAGLTSTTEPLNTPIVTKQVVSLQSVQLPVTFKVFTNEIATDLKLYFQLGGLVTINFYEKFKESDPASNGDYIKKYSPADFSIYGGAGVNYAIGTSNTLFAGLYYNRGLVNIFQNSSTVNYKDAARYNMDQFGLEVGVTF